MKNLAIPAAKDLNEMLRHLVRIYPQFAALKISAAQLIAANAATVCVFAQLLGISKSPLRLLVVGAEKNDALNKGRWYGLVSCLLGIDVTQVTLVGPEIKSIAVGHEGEIKDRVKYRLFHGTLKEFIASDNNTYDLAIQFHPGYEVNKSMLDDGSLRDFLGSRASVMCFASYHEDEFNDDKTILSEHGFSVTDIGANPYTFDIDNPFAETSYAAHLGMIRRNDET
jgi:hypothetical protein